MIDNRIRVCGRQLQAGRLICVLEAARSRAAEKSYRELMLVGRTGIGLHLLCPPVTSGRIVTGLSASEVCHGSYQPWQPR